MRGLASETDERSRKIMEFIRRNPQAKVAEIGAAVTLSRPATQKRIGSLLRTHKLERMLSVDLDSLGYRYRYRIDIKVNPSVLDQSAQLRELKTKIGNAQLRLAAYLMNYLRIEDAERAQGIVVEDVSVILGDPADLCLTVRTNDPAHILGFVTTDLRLIQGVENTSTCFEAWTYSRDHEFREELFRRLASKPRARRRSTAAKQAATGTTIPPRSV